MYFIGMASEYPECGICLYKVFHRFGQAKFAYGCLVLGSRLEPFFATAAAA